MERLWTCGHVVSDITNGPSTPDPSSIFVVARCYTVYITGWLSSLLG